MKPICPICRGSGKFIAEATIRAGAAGAPPPVSKPRCDACDGTGYVPDPPTVQLLSGKPVPITGEHRKINPATGMQKDYIVLSPEERAKGFVRPLRRVYVHQKCGVTTTMGLALAETVARDPYFYSGTFCARCRAHFPVGEDGEFVWDDGQKLGT